VVDDYNPISGALIAFSAVNGYSKSSKKNVFNLQSHSWRDRQGWIIAEVIAKMQILKELMELVGNRLIPGLVISFPLLNVTE